MTNKTNNWNLDAGNEWIARDPFGRIKPSDQSERSFTIIRNNTVVLRSARNGYSSFRLWVSNIGNDKEKYSLRIAVGAPLEADLFRAWYHKMAVKNAPDYCVDALIPVEPGSLHSLSVPDNLIPGQTHQEYWVDIFVPKDTPAGAINGTILFEAGGKTIEMGLRVEALKQIIPDEDAVICNRHSYGCLWIEEQYPRSFIDCSNLDEKWEKTIEILHHIYRLNYEHRGMLTNRGVGHSDTFDPVYGPSIKGKGRDKRIDDWTLFDRHYGPLLDGSVFETASPSAPRQRRPAKPVWCVATPMCAGWPADYLYWGQPGYDVEFVNCVRQFDQHFQDKGWICTHPYFFFVHKKRYRWLEWDGDEPKHAKDHKYFAKMGHLLKEALGNTPIPWLYRMDASWQMKNEFHELKDEIDWWVCGNFVRWYPDEVRKVKERGKLIWDYSGPPPIHSGSCGILERVWSTWARGLGGNVSWCTFESGPDPWSRCNGASTQLYYPGDRFGIPGPIPSIRLKLERNGVQDINLLAECPQEVKERLIENAPIKPWERPPAIVREKEPEIWDSRNLQGSQDDEMAETKEVEPLWWSDIRNTVLETDDD